MRSLHLLLFLSCCLLTGHQAFAQKDAEDDWYDGRDAWKSLTDLKNETVEVLEVGGRLVSGRLADVTETFLLVARNGTHDKVDRDRVHRITYVRPSTRARNTLLGMVYGVGSSAIFGFVMAGPHVKDIEWTPMGVLGMGLIGATGGGLIGFGTSRSESRNVVYDPCKDCPEGSQP